MESILAVLAIGIGINTILNVVYLFIFSGITRRLERIENLFIHNNK